MEDTTYKRYFCKKDVVKGRAYNILRGPIFRNWPASGFTDFQDGDGFVKFRHKSGIVVTARREEAKRNYNIEVSVDSDCSERRALEIFRDLSDALNIRLVTRRFYG